MTLPAYIEIAPGSWKAIDACSSAELDQAVEAARVDADEARASLDRLRQYFKEQRKR